MNRLTIQSESVEPSSTNNDESVDEGEDIHTDEQMFRIYGKRKAEGKTFQKETIKKLRKCCKCSRAKVKKAVHSTLPITQWLPRYNIKDDLLNDLAGGVTVGIVHLPQGMAYSLLANLPAVNGLYVSFFPVLIYILLGTTPHLSVGTFAVVSLMTGEVINKYVPNQNCQGGGIATTTISLLQNTTTAVTESYGNTVQSSCSAENSQKIAIAIALCIAIAIIHFAMYVLRLGIIDVFLPKHMVSGFTCGAAFHVFTSQVPKLFGISVPRKPGVFSLVHTYIDLFKNINTINWATVILSICCVIFLIIGKIINQKFNKKLPFPLPWELIVVIFSTIASQFGYFHDNYEVQVVGEIPRGIQTSVPNLSNIGLVMVDAIPIAIVIFSISISLSTLFSEKHAYKVYPNQELLAYAVANAFGSFFQCFPSCASLSRSIVWEQTGGKTQITGLVSCVLILITLLWIGPLFEALPQAALAAIIVVNLKGLLMQFNQLKPLWKVSELDAITWFVTWISVVLLGVDLGLYVGVGFSLLTVVLRTQITYGNILVSVGQTGIYRSSKRFVGIEDKNILVFKFPSPIIYANQQRFKNQLSAALGFKPSFEIARRMEAKLKADKLEAKEKKAKAKQEKHRKNIVVSHVSNVENIDIEIEIENDSVQSAASQNDRVENGVTYENPSNPINEQSEDVTDLSRYTKTGVRMPSHVILDMSICSFIDNDGVLAIKALCLCLSKLNIRLLLARSTADVRRCLLSGGFPPTSDTIDSNKPVFFISLNKAVAHVKSEATTSANNHSNTVSNGLQTTTNTESEKL